MLEWRQLCLGPKPTPPYAALLPTLPCSFLLLSGQSPLLPPGLPVDQPVHTVGDSHRKEAMEERPISLPDCKKEPSMRG